MDIRALQYFLAVAREESITKAAKALHMTQPPLSRQLKELEEEVGKQLIIRGSKKITLTEDGILLKKRAEEILSLVDKTKTELSSPLEQIAGDIYMGCGETEAVSLIANAAKALNANHPHIRYHIYSGNAEQLTEQLDNGIIDFALLVEPVDISKYDYLRLPVKDTWGVLMRRDSALAKQSSVSIDDISDKPLILSRQIYESKTASNILKREIKQLNVVSTYNLIYNASLFVKAGLGYAVALDKIINTSGNNELCFRPFEPLLEAGLCIVWKRYQVFSRAAEYLIKYMQELFPQDE